MTDAENPVKAHFMFQKGAIEMEVSGLLSGGAPVIKKYQVNATVANTGVPLLIGTSEEAGLDLPSTTVAADVVGLNLDTATYTTTQGSGSDSAERLVSVIINPDAVYRMRLSGGATAGTALAQFTVTAQDTAGTTITTGTAWNSPDMDEGVAWCYSGANVGQSRKIVDADGTTATLLIPFDNTIEVGDVFLRAPYQKMQGFAVQLTSDFTEANANIVVDTGAGFKTIDWALNDLSGEGTLKSYIEVLPTDHWLSSTA